MKKIFKYKFGVFPKKELEFYDFVIKVFIFKKIFGIYKKRLSYTQVYLNRANAVPEESITCKLERYVTGECNGKMDFNIPICKGTPCYGIPCVYQAVEVGQADPNQFSDI